MRIWTVLILLAVLTSACAEEAVPPPTPGTVPAVIYALRDDAVLVRLEAVVVLGGLGGAGGAAVSPLTGE